MSDKLSERVEIVHPGDPLGNAFWRDDSGANQRIPVPVAEALIALEQRVAEGDRLLLAAALKYKGLEARLSKMEEALMLLSDPMAYEGIPIFHGTKQPWSIAKEALAGKEIEASIGH